MVSKEFMKNLTQTLSGAFNEIIEDPKKIQKLHEKALELHGSEEEVIRANIRFWIKHLEDITNLQKLDNFLYKLMCEQWDEKENDKYRIPEILFKGTT